MKPSILGLLIAALAFGASTIYLSMQLNQERAQADKVAETIAGLNARIAELEQIREQRFAARGAFGSVEMAQGGMPMGPPPPPAENSDAKAAATDAIAVGAPPPRSEAFEKMMRTNMRASNKRLYADLGEKLGLSKEDASRLIDMLTDQQVENFGAMREMAATDPADRRRQMEDARREDQAELENFLGPTKAAALRDYQETIPARMEVEQIARQLEGADATLTDEQQKRMVAALAEERKRIPMPQYSNGDTPEEYMKAQTEWQADYNERVDAQARTILNSDQLTAYSDYQQWQKEMQSHLPVSRASRGQRLPGGNVTFSAVTTPYAGEAVAIVAPATEEKPGKKP